MKKIILTIVASTLFNQANAVDTQIKVTTTGPTVNTRKAVNVVDESKEFAIKVFGKKIVKGNQISIVDPYMTLVEGKSFNGVFIENLDPNDILGTGKKREYFWFSYFSSQNSICELFGYKYDDDGGYDYERHEQSISTFEINSDDGIMRFNNKDFGRFNRISCKN